MSSARRGSSISNDRRNFLKAASLASAGLMSLNARVHAAGDDAVKIALVGCGNRGSGAAAQALNTSLNVKLWAMADAFSDRLDESLHNLEIGAPGVSKLEKGKGFGERLDVAPDRRFVGLDAYRKAIDCGADVVILTGPPGFRPQHFEYAVNAGKHVFMEKPVATDAVGVRRVLAAAAEAKKKNLKVGVGLQRHHDATYVEAVKRIHEGEIGKIVTMRVYWNSGPPAKVAVPRKDMTELEYQVRNWYFFDWLSGDHICEQHIHNIDVGNWIKQAHPVKAEGLGGRQVRTGKEYGNIFDHHSVEYTYADGTKMFSSCRQIPGCKNTVAEFVEATQGSAELGTAKPHLKKNGETIWQGTRKRPKDVTVSPYQVEHNVLFDAIVNNRPHNEAENAAMSTMTAILGRLATYSGKEIEWDQAFQSKIALTIDAENWDAPAPVQPRPEGGYDIAVPGLTKVL